MEGCSGPKAKCLLDFCRRRNFPREETLEQVCSIERGLWATFAMVHFSSCYDEEVKANKINFNSAEPSISKYYQLPNPDASIISELFTLFLVLGLWKPSVCLSRIYVLVKVGAVVRAKPDSFGDIGVAAGS